MGRAGRPAVLSISPWEPVGKSCQMSLALGCHGLCDRPFLACRHRLDSLREVVCTVVGRSAGHRQVHELAHMIRSKQGGITSVLLHPGSALLGTRCCDPNPMRGLGSAHRQPRSTFPPPPLPSFPTTPSQRSNPGLPRESDEKALSCHPASACKK